MNSLKDKKIIFATWSSNNKYWHAHQMWDGPLRKLFGKVVTFDPQEQINNFGKEQMNANFLATLKREQPDYVFMWIMFEEFNIETLFEMRKLCPKTKFIDFCGDDDIKFEDHTLHLIPFFDYFFLTQPNYFKKYNGKAYFMCGVNTDEFFPLKLEKKYDLSFVGSPKGDRVKLLRSLLDKKLNIKIGGSGWSRYPEFEKVYCGKVSSAEFVKLINETKINLCLSNNIFSKPHLLERFFEVNACNSFQITQYCEGYHNYFREGKEIVTFKTQEDFLQKIILYLAKEKERKLIAEAAYKKTINTFTTDKLLEKAFFKIDLERKENDFKKQIVNENYVYLFPDDLFLSKIKLKNKIGSARYVFFKGDGFESLPYRETIQINSLKEGGKNISISDFYHSSFLIKNYASLCSRGLLEYYGLKKLNHFIKLQQLMVRKDYLLENINHFKLFYKNSKGLSFDFEKTAFVSIPLLSSNIKVKIPLDNREHFYFAFFERDLLWRKNKGLLFFDSYLYRFLLLLMIDRNCFRYFFTQTLYKTKIPFFMKISQLVNSFIL